MESYGTFEEMGLKDVLVNEIKAYGYEMPTPLQQRIIVPLCGSEDVLVEVAKFEPGKAQAICLGILQKLNCGLRDCQALVFTAGPMTSQMIGKDMPKLGASLHLDLKVHILGDDDPGGSYGTHVFVGHLPFAMDWLEKEGGAAWTQHIKVVILDKADMLCCHGQVSYIFSDLLPSRDKYQFQICVFSETVSSSVEEFVLEWMNVADIKKIHFPSTLEQLDEGEGDEIHQIVSVLYDKMKPHWLLMLFNSIKTTTVVFVDDPQMVGYLSGILKDQRWENPKWEVFSTNDDMDQRGRRQLEQSLQAEGCPKVLITTAEWANGLDLRQVQLVVSYDLTRLEPDRYLHRMRRFGDGADAIHFVNKYEWRTLFEIQEHYKGKVTFEGTPLQPLQVGPAGFSQLPESLEEILKIKPLPGGIKHILYYVVEGDESKYAMILEDLSAVLATTKSVIYAAKGDLHEALRREGFRVFTRSELDGFLECQEQRCTMVITDDTGTQNHPPDAEVPLVINIDLPSAPGLYNQRLAWCGSSGVALHFVTDNDWFKAFLFQNPPGSVLEWEPSVDKLVDIIAKANTVKSQDDKSVQERVAKRAKLMESGLDEELTEVIVAQSSQETTAKKHTHFLEDPQLPVSQLFLAPKPVEQFDVNSLNKMVELHLGPLYANMFV